MTKKLSKKLKKILYFGLCCCCCPSRHIRRFVRNNFHCLLPRPKWMGDKITAETFATLGLSLGHLGDLHKCFKEIDEDGSGQIDIHEFLMYVDAPLTPFSKRVFGIMDEDGSGSMDFREFVIACWNYCSFEKAGLILFAYDLYDADHNGSMSVNECKAMFSEVYGDKFVVAEKGFKLFDKLEKLATDPAKDTKDFDIITKKQFVGLINTHVNVLMPAFQIQNAIQSKIIGKRFWSRITMRRMKNMNGEDWHRHRGAVVAKVDSKAILNKYHDQKANEILDRMKNSYRSQLIGRLGEFNPQMDTERRLSYHSKLRNLNYESFEDLQVMRANHKLPAVLLDRKPPSGYSTVAAIATDPIANLPQWDDNDYSTLEQIHKDVKDILAWQRTMIDSKEIGKFKSGAPHGYTYKDNIESGPVVKIKVDKNSKLIDWTKVKIHTFDDDDNNWEDEEEARDEVAKMKEKERRTTKQLELKKKSEDDLAAEKRLKMLGVGGSDDEEEEGEEVDMDAIIGMSKQGGIGRSESNISE